MARGKQNKTKPSQIQRKRMRKRKEKNPYKSYETAEDLCYMESHRKHPILDWCMTCQKRKG